MKTIKDIVKSVLEISEYPYKEEDDMLIFLVGGDNCVVDLKIHCDEEVNVLSVNGLVNMVVPKHRRTAVLAQINELNAGNTMTKFTLVMSDCRIMCRCTCNTDNGALNTKVAKLLISAVIEMLDNAYPSLLCASLGISTDMLPRDAENEGGATATNSLIDSPMDTL